MSKGNVADAGKDFDAALVKSHDAAQLRKTWEAVQHSAGDFRKLGLSRVITVDGRLYVLTRIVFSKRTLDSIGACDANGRISFYEWSRDSDAEDKIAAAKPRIGPDGIRIVPTVVMSEWGPLPAILTFPRGDGQFPAAVLVAGAGPNDEDETIGPNKPFRDLAEGLAADGIASLRYDKSIRDYPAEAGLDTTLTVDDEVTDDAVTALNLLRSMKQIDAHRVFLLGHSLGAMMAPRIAERSPGIVGVIMMAPPAESLLDNGLQQTRYIAGVLHTTEADLQKQLGSLNQEKALLARTRPGQTLPGRFMGMPQIWWMSLYRYNQVREAELLRVPILIVQGASDFQVSPQGNFTRWQSVFVGDPRVTLIEYKGLSHIFTPSGNPPSPADYDRPARMDSKVIDDIANWMHAQVSIADR